MIEVVNYQCLTSQVPILRLVRGGAVTSQDCIFEVVKKKLSVFDYLDHPNHSFHHND